MLDSMIRNQHPVAQSPVTWNAILDGTDAVMLSGESAKGKYPLEAVSIMATICERTDRVMNHVSSSTMTTVNCALQKRYAVVPLKLLKDWMLR